MTIEIYATILANGHLAEEHREQLKVKRGFTDDTIARNKFFSGGGYLSTLEAELVQKFPEDKLLASGVMHRAGNALVMSDLLLDNRIIIPYLNKDSQPYLLRPHKLGLHGVQIEIYQELNLTDRKVIITEGEFKAAACVQLGIPAIAIPGISSFATKHFRRLVNLLNSSGVKEICIIYDNEVKDNPDFPSYKDHPADRYDVQYFAHLMAELLHKEGFVVRIGWLPDSWRINGKADLDGALAQGKTYEDLGRIIINSKTYKEFYDELPDEAKKIMVRKRAKRFFRSMVKKDNGRYWAVRKVGKYEDFVEVSNFTIKIMATHSTMEGIVREVMFTNEHNEKTKPFPLAPEQMGDGFKTFCLGKGNFIWKGQQSDLDYIWEEQFLDDDGRHIMEYDHVGWVPEEKLWLFGNTAIRHDGTELRPDANGVFWTDKKGIKPIPLGVSSGKNTIVEGIPTLDTRAFDVRELLARMIDSVGELAAKVILGWIGAVLFMEETFEIYRCFPFLFLTGKKGCGKSTIAEWMTNVFGLETGGKQAADTTSVGLQRYLSYYSSLPVFIDEYRNTMQVQAKNGLLRNCYNRQSAGKGIKADFGVREAKIRGTLLVTGEETPEDNALLTRCVVVNVSLKNRKSNQFNWFSLNRLRLSNITYQVLRDKHKLIKDYVATLAEGKDAIVASGADDRTAINYAAVAGGYRALLGEDLDFAVLLTEMAVTTKKENEEEHAINLFLEDLVALRTRELLPDGKYATVCGDKLYFFFHGAYMIWAQEYRKARGIEAFKEGSIRSYLQEETGYLDHSKQCKIGGINKKCFVFDAATAPESLKTMANYNGQMSI